MRKRTAAVPTLILLATFLAGASPSASADEPEVPLVKSVGSQLPVDDFRAIELDEDRDRLYLAQGAHADLPLVVTDLDGGLITRLSHVTHVSDVVLSDDQQTVYVTQGFSRVAALDGESLAISAIYPAPDGACVYAAEPTGGKIVGAFRDCGIGSGGLLVWTSQSEPPVVYTDGPDYVPRIDASPGAPGLVVAGDDGISPVRTYVIDVSGAEPRVIDQRGYTGSNLNDYALSPDGTEVVVSVGHPYEHHSYTVPELDDSVVYPSGTYPLDAAWSGDGSTVAIGLDGRFANDADVYLYDRGSTVPSYALDFGYIDQLWGGTLLVNSDGTRAWAVSFDDVYQNRQLLHSFGPVHPPTAPVTDLDVSATTGSGKHKRTAFVDVSWSSPTGEHYWWITASTDGGPEREFWRGKMDSSGSYSLEYELPKGTTTFTVRYDDFYDWWPSGFATATVTR